MNVVRVRAVGRSRSRIAPHRPPSFPAPFDSLCACSAADGSLGSLPDRAHTPASPPCVSPAALLARALRVELTCRYRTFSERANGQPRARRVSHPHGAVCTPARENLRFLRRAYSTTCRASRSVDCRRTGTRTVRTGRNGRASGPRSVRQKGDRRWWRRRESR